MSDEPKTIEFNKSKYTKGDLKTRTVDELVKLRNLIAENLGVAKVRNFKTLEDAVEGTWSALVKFHETATAEGEGKEAKKAEKPPRERPKCYSAETVKRPSRRMFMRIKKVREPESHQRPFAWDHFKDGERLIDLKEDPDRHAGKISFWLRQKPPLIELEDISDEQFQKELDAWYEKHGRVNPDKAKREAKEKREAEKAEREKERLAKREAKEKEKAEKKAAAEKKKAEKEEAKKKAAAEKPAPAKKQGKKAAAAPAAT